MPFSLTFILTFCAYWKWVGTIWITKTPYTVLQSLLLLVKHTRLIYDHLLHASVFTDFNSSLLKWNLLFWGNLWQKMLPWLKGGITTPSNWSSLFSVALEHPTAGQEVVYSGCQPLGCLFVKEGWWYSVNWGIKRLRVQKCRSHHQIERCIAVTFAVSCTCICTHWVQISTSLTIINKRSVNIFSNIYWIFFGSAFLGIQETFCLRKIGTKFYPFSTNQNSLSVLSHFYPPSLHFYLTRTYIL